VAFTYGLLMVLHIVFDLFFALSIVCARRGIAMAIQARLADRAAAREALPEPAVAVAQ
jgi:enediyne biosynthesis protein E5